MGEEVRGRRGEDQIKVYKPRKTVTQACPQEKAVRGDSLVPVTCHGVIL